MVVAAKEYLRLFLRSHQLPRVDPLPERLEGTIDREISERV